MSDDASNEGLPTAAYKVTAERSHLDSDIEVVKKSKPQHHREDIDQVDELVRRSDHEKKLRVAQSEKYQEGFVNGMEKKEEDVKELIQDKIEQVEVYPSDQEIAIEQSKILQELLEEVEGEPSK